MKKVVKLTESDLVRLIKRVISENMGSGGDNTCFTDILGLDSNIEVPEACVLFKKEPDPNDAEYAISCMNEIYDLLKEEGRKVDLNELYKLLYDFHKCNPSKTEQ